MNVPHPISETSAPVTNAASTVRFAAIFDVDGTMVDNARFHEAAWIELCQRRGKPITAEFYREHIHARSNDGNVRKVFGASSSPEFIREVGWQKENLYRETFRPVMKEVPGLTALLHALSARGVPCAAASNSPKENVDMVLDGLGIRPFFRAVIDRDQVSKGKPDPEILLTAAARLGVPPGKCVVFEDSVSGVAAARRAGMPCIFIVAGSTDVGEAANAAAAYASFVEVDPDRLAALVAAG